MGYMKRLWEEQIARGFDFVGDKYVCADCFDDYAIRKFINDNAEEKVCSYCGACSSEPIAAHIDEVIGFIVEGIESEWGDPDNEGVPWESAEGGYQGNVIDSYDLIMDELGLEIHKEELLQDIINSIIDRQWCQRNFYALRPEQRLIFGWREFAKQVKHHIRYVFFRVVSSDQDDFWEGDEIAPSQMLDRLARVVSELGLVSVIKAGERLWRVRIHDPSESYSTAKDLGPPLEDEAKYSNRMSPAGIPMFYGAFDEQTALAETFQRRDEKPAVATIARFKILRELRVLNLMSLPNVPSLFDSEQGTLRPSVMFLHSFVADVTKPIEKDGREHINYVPTQVFTEYFRHVYKDDKGNRLEGILYPSARNKGGIACVLFLENKHCCDMLTGDKADASKVLVLEGKNRMPL